MVDWVALFYDAQKYLPYNRNQILLFIIFHPMESILGPITPFLDRIFHLLDQDGIDISPYELDHVCYRVETEEEYERLKTLLQPLGEMLTEPLIGGRYIATFKMIEPIQYKERKIWCLELPSPKTGSPYKEGYEHVEFVIDKPFEEFMSLYSSLTFKTKGMSKEVNPEISRKYGDLAVKFHHHTIEYVIRYMD